MWTLVSQKLFSFEFLIAVILLASVSYSPVFGQENTEQNTQVSIDISKIDNSSLREEVQRYFGYEDLIFRYLTIPYDMSQNVNQVGRHVDMGFAIFAVLPLVLLILAYRHKRLFYLILVLIVLYLSLCFSFGQLLDTNEKYYRPYDEAWSAYLESGEKGLDGDILSVVYQGALLISHPIRSFLTPWTGSEDYITYPLLGILFIGMLWLTMRTTWMKQRSIYIAIITIAFFFLWWILSGGIVWYGFLMIPLFYMIIMRAYTRSRYHLPQYMLPFFKNLVVGVLGIWLVMGFVERTSYVNLGQRNPKTMGQDIESPMLMLYSTGLITADESREISAKNFSKAIKSINSDDRIVWQVGTHFVFEIKNNSERVFEDNALGHFFSIYKKYPDKIQFVEWMKSQGVGYILVDLNTPRLDRTPEQTLKKKYQLLLNQLYRNPRVRLIATDREVMITDVEGQKIRVFEVFGDSYPVTGTYAVYEIL